METDFNHLTSKEPRLVEDLVWLPCKCGTTCHCTYPGAWNLASHVEPGQAYYGANLEASKPDLTALVHLSPPCLLHALALRYRENSIYTLTGTMLLSINPYKTIDGLYGEEKAKVYRRHASADPHLFQTAQAALDGVCDDRPSNQSILISGESGAGKTVATKLILEYLALTGSQKEDRSRRLTSLVLKANPLLETFGNASTLRNHNSSRFGKYIRVGINPLDGSLSSLSITTYLLEKIRLLHHLDGERSFHVFYDPVVTGEVEGAGGFNPLEGTEAPKLTHLLEDFGMDPPLMKRLVETFQAFKRQDLEGIATLLGVDGDLVRDAMRVKRIVTREGEIETPLTEDQAMGGLEAAAIWLYDNLFSGVVARVNGELAKVACPSEGSKTIGLLDIFGFEVFDAMNGFEQLCINFTNERIQTVFNNHIFVLEQRVYAEEGLDWSDVDFPDNLAIVDDLDKLLDLATEECLVPQGSDKALAGKIDRSGFESVLVSSKQRVEGLFEVHHYAGPVTYTTQDFCAKNRGDLAGSWKEILRESMWVKGEKWKELFSLPLEGLEPPEGRSGHRSNRRLQTVLTLFRKNVGSLIQELSSTSLHFIRCLKPNDLSKSDLLDHKRLEIQLAYCGVLEAIRIARAGYPVRYLHQDFLRRFSMVKTDDVEVKRGHTKVFLKNESSIALETRRRTRRREAAISIQAFRRGLVCRREFLFVKGRVVSIQGWWRARRHRFWYLQFLASLKAFQRRRRFLVVKRRVIFLQALYRGMRTRRHLKILQRSLAVGLGRRALANRRCHATRIIENFICERWLACHRQGVAEREEARRILLVRLANLLVAWESTRKIQGWWRRLGEAFRRKREMVPPPAIPPTIPPPRHSRGHQPIRHHPTLVDIGIQSDDCWTVVFDNGMSKENERLKIENSLLQREWAQVQESIHEMRQRLDPLLCKLANLRDENRELKRMLRTKR